MKKFLGLIALTSLMVSCGPCETEKCEEVCDSTKTDSVECVMNTTVTTVTEADTLNTTVTE
jgi:carbohydrate-binding DOMON domain-containing protein